MQYVSNIAHLSPSLDVFVVVKYVSNRFIQDFYLWPMEVWLLSGSNRSRSIRIAIDGGCRFLFVGFYPHCHCSIRDVLGLILCSDVQSVTMRHTMHTNCIVIILVTRSISSTCIIMYNGDTIQRHTIQSLHKNISKKKSSPCMGGSMHECTGWQSTKRGAMHTVICTP